MEQSDRGPKGLDHKVIPNVLIGDTAEGTPYYFKDLLDETPELDEWIRQLLNENQALRSAIEGCKGIEDYYALQCRLRECEADKVAQAKKIARLKGANEFLFENREKWRESHMLLEQENARYREALEWYANAKYYENGRRASTALNPKEDITHEA